MIVPMRLTKCAQKRWQQRLGGGVDRGNAHRRAHATGRALRHARAELEQAEGLDRVRQERLSSGAQLHAAAVALRQRNTDLLAQGGDRTGYRRLRHLQPLGCRAHGAILGHCDERAQLRECHSH
jgi:hypothetical protein